MGKTPSEAFPHGSQFCLFLTIQSDNGSHFSNKGVKEWAKQEGIKWAFHTPYYPQCNGMVEQANELLKRYLKPHQGQQDPHHSKPYTN